MSKISVIVPVYNVVDELSQCLDSLINQTYEELDIIVVNDGSTDGSASLCQEYAEKDKRIKLIHQKNAGLSAARNRGIDEASGDYLAFIDSDDWVETDYFQVLYDNMIAYKADISVINFYRYFDESREFVWYSLKGEAPTEVKSSKEILEDYYNLKHNRYTNVVVAWGKLYKRCLFEGLRYPVGRYCEDDFTTYKAIMKAKKLVFSYDPLYIYRERQSSLSDENFTVRRLLDYREAHEERIALLAIKGYDIGCHIQPYLNKLAFLREKFLDMGEIDEYERTVRDMQLVELTYGESCSE